MALFELARRIERAASKDPARLTGPVEVYVRLPATPTRARREDRRLAAELHARGVPFAVLEAALLLGVVRKATPPTEALPLTTIRSLHYFLPVVEEIMRDPPTAPYIDYLREIVAESVREYIHF